MYDISADLQSFYDVEVRLGSTLRNNLAGYRDLNLKRLNGGLEDLEDETGKSHPKPSETKNQGSYAMHTLNHDPSGDNGYDIDVALIFRKEDLPSTALAARQRVRDALLKRCTNFIREPDARTNAVTVWYAEGYHVDFAIYRTWTDASGTVYVYHASTEWKARDPMRVTTWFQTTVDNLSPKDCGLGIAPNVAPGQFRRIVRFLKWFSRSRTGWSMPGGMVISALLADPGIYQADRNRDDISLYRSMAALRERLRYNTVVTSPVDGSNLAERTERKNEVIRLGEELGTALDKLAVLFTPGCTLEQARSAWNWVFNHEFWGGDILQESVVKSSALDVHRYTVQIRCELAKREQDPVYKIYESGSLLLPKGIGLKFTMAATSVPPPFQIVWSVKNEGDEAREDDQETWSKTGQVAWTSTLYKGTHRMTCRIVRYGQVLAETSHIVRIAPGTWKRQRNVRMI